MAHRASASVPLAGDPQPSESRPRQDPSPGRVRTAQLLPSASSLGSRGLKEMTMRSFTLYSRVTVLALAGAVGGCSGQTSTAAYVPSAARSHVLDGNAPQPDAKVRIFTANRGGASVLAFSTAASGNVAPVTNIAGPKTKFSMPGNLALDGSGDIYTSDDNGTKVEVFGPNANGNVKPKRVVGGKKSDLGPTEGILVDPSGDLWVSGIFNNDVTEYAPGAHGNVKPINTIAGGYTQLYYPKGLAMDAAGQLYVVNTTPAILVFAEGASGDVSPVASIAGSKTGLSSPYAIAFDSKGRLLVADEDAGILVFGKGATGNVAPSAIITGLDNPTGVVADAHDRIWVVDFGTNAIDEYAKNANGNATPLRTIQGQNTTLDQPLCLALR